MGWDCEDEAGAVGLKEAGVLGRVFVGREVGRAGLPDLDVEGGAVADHVREERERIGGGERGRVGEEEGGLWEEVEV